MARKPNHKMMALQVENWNLKHPVGTSVIVTRDRIAPSTGKPERTETTTTSEAYVLSGHSVVIHCAGISGCYLLDRVQPR